MFTYIKLKNYKSFGDVTLDFRDKKGKAKKLILIYGENGIGKSNLASAFFLLSETLRTMDVRDVFQELLKNDPESLSNDEFMAFIKTRFQDMETLIKTNKMVDSKENLYLEFGFEVNQKVGKYILEMNDEEIVYECLEYTLVKNKGICFEISKNKLFLSDKIFIDKTLVNDLKMSIDKFWGKHSFLAIVYHDIYDKNRKYYEDKMSVNFAIVLQFFKRVSCQIKYGTQKEKIVIGLPTNYLKQYDSGEIDLEEKEKLVKTEKMLNVFLTSTYKDIDGVFYKTKMENNKLRYKLYIKKRIYGKTRNIDFDFESTGTMSLIKLLPFMLITVEGSTAIIDEFDTGIHDLLVENLITSLNEFISGQLIMTTHNTLLMESKIPKESFYTINEKDDFNKEISCILKYDNKINVNTNIRNQYIHGKYKGIPDKVSINFEDLINMI